MSDAFRTADQAMLRIKINLEDVPEIMTSLVNAYAKVVFQFLFQFRIFFNA